MPNDYGHEYADNELKRLEKRIAKEYKQAAKEVEKKMNDYLAKFAEKDTKMKKRLEAGEITASEYAEWRMRQMFTGDRWKAMSDTLSADLVNADKIAAGMINDSLPSSYAENFNYGTYEVEHGAKMNTNFVLYDKDTVINLMKDDPKIIPKANVDIPKDMVWNKRKIVSAVTQGILQGEAIPKIAKRLQSVTDMDRRAAIRNARTYTTAAENKGRIDSYDRAKDMGINVKKEWLATLDELTRMEHRHLDGMAVDNDEPFETDGYKIMYPGDPDAEPEMIYNCRCAIVARIVDYKYNDERNDSKLGDMTYEEWKHAKDKPGMEAVKEEPKIQFVPATTTAEAEEYASRFAENVNYKGMSLETVNVINERLTELSEKYPINKLQNIEQKKGKYAMAANYNSLKINKQFLGKTLNEDAERFKIRQKEAEENKKYWTDKFAGKKMPRDVQKIVDQYTKTLSFDRWGVLDSYDDKIKAVMTHEYGHIIADQYFGQINETRVSEKAGEYYGYRQRWDEIYKEAYKTGDIYKMSGYAGTHSHEYFAECFAAREYGEELPGYVEEFMKEVLDNGPM